MTNTGTTAINGGTLYVRGDQGATLGASPVDVTVESGATLQGERGNFAGSLTMNGGTWWENNGFGGSWTGPVYLGAGLAEGGNSNYYLFFGAPPRWQD